MSRRPGEAAEGIIFPCGSLLIAQELPNDNPQKSLLMDYKAKYEALYNEEASTFGGYANDALLILKTAIENAKSIERDDIASAIEKLKDLPGISGVFNMSDTDHNGLGMDSIVLLTVKDGKFTAYS